MPIQSTMYLLEMYLWNEVLVAGPVFDAEDTEMNETGLCFKELIKYTTITMPHRAALQSPVTSYWLSTHCRSPATLPSPGLSCAPLLGCQLLSLSDAHSLPEPGLVPWTFPQFIIPPSAPVCQAPPVCHVLDIQSHKQEDNSLTSRSFYSKME